ncbi:MAG TPA: TonB-dependent receptor [Hyphomonadaceae bacterium]|nr:TonB-dependent receptor [Hyphomonadaceae bacterium]
MKFKLLVSVAAATLVSGAAWAQSAPPADFDAAASDTITVIGQGEVRQVQTLTAEDLSIEAAGSSPIKLIESLPGVNYTAADPFGAYEWAVNINIRGFQKDQLGYTLDGVPLGDMSYGNYNGLHISRAIISENLSKVELAQGAAALSTASSSNLGGALAFTSRAPDDMAGGAIALSGGSDAMFRGYVRLETGAIDAIGGGKASLSYVNHTQDKWKQGGEQKNEAVNFRFEQPIGPGVLSGFYNTSTRRETDYQDLSLAMIGRLGYGWDNLAPDWNRANLVGDVAANLGQSGVCNPAFPDGSPTSAPCPNPAAGTAYPAPILTADDAYYDASGLRDDAIARLTYDWNVFEGLDVSATAYIHEDEGQGIWFTPYVNPFQFGAPISQRATISSVSVRTTEYDMNRSGLLGSATWELGDHTIEGGFWYEYNDFNQDRRFYANDRAAPRPTLEFMRNAFATQWSFGYDFETDMFYIQDTWKLNDQLTLFGGFKSLKVEMTVDTNMNNFVVPVAGSNDDMDGSITSEDNFLPQIGFTYELTPDSEIFAGYTENMRAFTLAPAASNTQSGFDFIKANTDPESSKTAEAGWRYRTGGFQGTATGYYVKFDDRLVGLSSGPGIIGSPSVIKNVGSVTTYGIELAAGYDFTDEISGFASYSYNDSTYDDDVNDPTLALPVLRGGKTVVNAADHLFKADLKYDNGSFYAQGSMAYTGDRFFSYENDAKADGYTVVDASAGYRFSGGYLEGLEVQVNATNLLDEEFISTIGTNGFTARGDSQTLMVGSPRAFFATVRKTF